MILTFAGSLQLRLNTHVLKLRPGTLGIKIGCYFVALCRLWQSAGSPERHHGDCYLLLEPTNLST